VSIADPDMNKANTAISEKVNFDIDTVMLFIISIKHVYLN